MIVAHRHIGIHVRNRLERIGFALFLHAAFDNARVENEVAVVVIVKRQLIVRLHRRRTPCHAGCRRENPCNHELNASCHDRLRV